MSEDTYSRSDVITAFWRANTKIALDKTVINKKNSQAALHSLQIMMDALLGEGWEAHKLEDFDKARVEDE